MRTNLRLPSTCPRTTPHETGTSLTRRQALGAAALALAGPTLIGEAAAAAGVGSAMVDRATTFLASLDDDQRNAAAFPFDNPTRASWNYMLGSSFAPGLPLERMNGAQKIATLDLLATGLGSEGMAKAERVMILQDVLREMGKGSADRNRDRFSMMVFGTPSATEPWGWRFEGHHLTLSFTLIGDQVISVTPSSFSSDPNTVASGRHRGTIALVDEEAMGRRLFSDLSPTNRAHALLSESSYGNVLALAGREDRVPDEPAGVPVADLAPAQADLVQRLVDIYAVDHLVTPLASEQERRLRDGDPMATRFGWAGDDGEGQSIYYRLHGETFLIEFASLRNQPQHLHTIRHDRERNLGAHLLS